LTPNDPFNEFYGSSTLQSLTSVDLTMMDVLGFNVTGTVSPPPSPKYDFNGDRMADLAFQTLDNRFLVSLSTGTGYAPASQWMQHGGTFIAGQAQYADVNGDGTADLVYQGLDNRFWVSTSTGNGFTAPQQWVQHGGGFIAGEAQYADLNGDGRADLLYQGLDNRFWVSLSTGTGFADPQQWVQHGGGFVAGEAQYADLNGDGRADLIYQGLDNRFWVSLSGGSGFNTPRLWADLSGISLQFQVGQAQYADANGDGRADLFFQGPDNKEYLSLSNGVSFGSPQLIADFGGSFHPGQLHV
jgi:hypothetical protein